MNQAEKETINFDLEGANADIEWLKGDGFEQYSLDLDGEGTLLGDIIGIPCPSLLYPFVWFVFGKFFDELRIANVYYENELQNSRRLI